MMGIAIRGATGGNWGQQWGQLTHSRDELPPMQLTDIAIRKGKPTDKPQRLPDGGGLYLELSEEKKQDTHQSEYSYRL